MSETLRVLAVCLGNICRSPTAEAALREAAEEAGIDLVLDSAGTGGWHIGNPPDPRMRSAGAEVGLSIDGAARTVEASDFERFDVILAMDASNRRDLSRLAPSDEARNRIRLYREFDPDADDDLDVPDPYYGGRDGFFEVVDIARRSAREFVRRVQAGEL